METTPNLQVYDLGHLGLVASIVDQIGLVQTVDQFVGPRPGKKVSTGMALKAAILNALGFVTSPLYLFGHFFQGKPTEPLLGPGITPELLNDDRMGRMLDSLYAAGVTELFVEVAKSARRAFPFPVRALHVDSTSFHVHGVYRSGEEGQTDTGDEPLVIRLTHGYSRDHRPDLKQWVMNLICADTGGNPLLFAPGDGNQSDQEALVPLLARYRQGLELGEVVVLDGASYSQENLGALQGFSWVMRVPATLKEARALLRKELPQEAWRPLLPGYRGLEVESEYGGVRQRWLLVESQERARMEEASLRQRIVRAEGEARKVLGQLTARTFACEADARRALSEASGRLPLHRLVYLGVQEERQWERVGRPRKGERPLAVVYRLRARLEVDQEKLERARRGLGRFLLATNVLDREGLPPQEVLRRYKDQARTVERGFRFLKDPLFFAESTFLKRPERVMALGMVMALALLVYALGEWALRRRLWEAGSSLPDQKGRPTAKPTLRWVFQLFMWVRLVELGGRWFVLNLAPHHETAARLLGAGRYYLLE
ncbi:IS1634-like element ISTth3 family transposase [Thermus thermophilus]|uniref:IS4 family transposase n=1 Tax=Thermus thermophilus TaxID=274 RepID=A0A7R7TFS0_THETH|nr:IS1634-like element ISTth3 family transposase [Thermus thermophilus]BCP67353.1 IS4 family transposase [Thermus thermophilus]